MKKLKFRFTYPKMIAGGFALIILLGAALLCLPAASRNGQSVPFLSALFTSTSSTCVTGLVVFDTYTQWSLFGQMVILVLIQIGGIGFITLMTAFMMAIDRRISLKERDFLRESLNTPDISGMETLIRRIIFGTLIFETAGAALLAIRFIPEFGAIKGIYNSIFMSVSAFCNAGFDLMGQLGEYSSLTCFADDPVIILTVSALIIIGGIGFIVWGDIIKNGVHFRKYRLHSKIVLVTTFVLLVVSTLLFLVLERNSTNKGIGFSEQLLNSFFDAVTPRTAGFNSVDTAQLSEASKILTQILMFIGGSPGSTAGGIKTTTIAVLFVCLISSLRNKSGYNVMRRRISGETVLNAVCVVLVDFSLAAAGMVIICAAQPQLMLSDVMFECFSAIGTVGMSTGITRDLNQVSMIVITLLMFCGRIGTLSFALIFTEKKRKEAVMLPAEKVNVG